MAVKKTNTRVIITCSKEQAEWLNKTSKKLKMSRSRFIKYLMDKNIAHLVNHLTTTDQELLFKIAKTKWLDLDDDEQ